MNVERLGWIDEVGPAAACVRLAAQCNNCGGCGGRCSLLGGAVGAVKRIELPLNVFDAAPVVNQPVRLYLPGSSLMRQARGGYGLPLTGLLFGALLGHATALAIGADAGLLAPDPLAVLFASAGTLIGIGISKRELLAPPCRVGPADCSGCTGDAPSVS